MIEVHCLLIMEQLCVKIQGRVGGNVYTIVDVDLRCKTCHSFVLKFISKSVRIAKLCCQCILFAFNGENNIKTQFGKREHGLVCSLVFLLETGSVFYA